MLPTVFGIPTGGRLGPARECCIDVRQRWLRERAELDGLLSPGGDSITPTTSVRLLTSAVVFMASLAGPGPGHATLTRHGGEIDVRTAKGILSPSLAALPGGGFVVTWSEPAANWESSGAAMQGRALVTSAPSGAFVLRSEKNVVAAWFDADGQLIRGPLVVNQTPTGITTVNWYAQAAAAADGTVLVAWRGWEAGTVLARFFDAQGNAMGDEAQLNPERTLYDGDIAVAATAPGTFIVLWNEVDITLPYNRVFLIGRSVAKSGTLGDVFLVSPIEAPADQILPSVVSLDSQRLLVTWFNEVGEQTVQARFLGDDPLLPAFDVAGGEDERRPRVCALKSGEFVFAWEGYQSAFAPPSIVDRGAWFRRYNAMREPLGDPLAVLPADNQVQHVSGFVCPPEGAPMVVIDYNGVLIGRSLDGATLTTEFEIGRSYGGPADVVSVSVPAFVVTWAQCADPGENIETDCELRAQIFSRDGQLPCPGDCNLNRHVTIDELVLATRIALVADGAEMRACLPADRNLDYRVDVSELVRAVATSLGGCE